MHINDLIDIVYGDQADGGPEWAAASLRSVISELKRKGFPIRSRRTIGYWYEGTKMRVFPLLVVAILLAFPAAGHIAGHPEWTAWLMAQKVPDGSNVACCDRSDAYVLGDNDVRPVGDDIEALVNGDWIRFRNAGPGKQGNQVLGDGGNPSGSFIAWAIKGHDGTYYARCFSGPSGT